MSKAKPKSPPIRCPHGYLALVIIDDGWQTPTAPAQCRSCLATNWKGAVFKLGTGIPAVINLSPRPIQVECPESGCCVLIEPGVPHETPHLDPDKVAKVNIYHDDYPVPLSVEIDESVCWHAPKEWNAHTGHFVVSYCGKRGRPTDHSDLVDLVDCKTCLKRRP